jgi:hypothetical protein
LSPSQKNTSKKPDFGFLKGLKKLVFRERDNIIFWARMRRFFKNKAFCKKSMDKNVVFVHAFFHQMFLLAGSTFFNN